MVTLLPPSPFMKSLVINFDIFSVKLIRYHLPARLNFHICQIYAYVYEIIPQKSLILQMMTFLTFRSWYEQFHNFHRIHYSLKSEFHILVYISNILFIFQIIFSLNKCLRCSTNQPPFRVPVLHLYHVWSAPNWRPTYYILSVSFNSFDVYYHYIHFYHYISYVSLYTIIYAELMP